ncbi:MAG: bifunctional [glutamate--ammonia ligase]-adenylyl-L-tyrosine phosphorylase/[glutamate--ammonia-ligase] adenylyltransferase [Rhodospirillales bacterium]|nr:bifunctional [glutamate--ammonia ligase]-adenylyl-L-tyrosine phosphorylase/[glutamate--ammonia-ligase] adenylyltransferase [Rhodospirillales bacterium]
MNIASEWKEATRPPLPADEAALALCWERWRENAARSEDDDLIAFAEACEGDATANALLGALFGNSRYLSHCVTADQDFARLLIEQGPDAAYAAARAMAADTSVLGDESRQQVMKRLRVAKRRASLAIGMADIAAVWPLERVTGALSDIASVTLSAVCAHLLRNLHDRGKLALPDPEAPEQGSGLIILGMGKLGAGELNYSSDVDIIVLFDEEIASDPSGDGLQQIFARLARHLVTIMDERTADGYVFRTDLRLRPDPGSTAAALSVRAAEAYYATTGENWERAAMIKAKPVAGDIEAGDGFLERLQPFVWRRHLDFAAIQNIRAIKRQIDAHRGVGQVAVVGHNVKLGRGGIREIEFLAQTQQLIWGGRDPALRVRGTRQAFDLLVEAGHMRRQAVEELMEAYTFHRTVEHRLQMVDDRQTHSLPDDEDGVAQVAIFLGFDTLDDFTEALLARLRTVERHYTTLFEDEPSLTATGTLDFSPESDGDATLETLASMGYAHPERAFETLRAWHEGRYRAVRGEEARERLAELLPTVLDVFAAWPDPDSALALFDGFLARLPAGSHLFSMFAAHPELFDLITEIMGSAPRLAGWLEHRPMLLDSVLSREFSDLDVPDADELGPELATIARRGLVRVFYQREFGTEEMKAELGDIALRERDLQDFLDAERRWANDKIFHIGVHMLRGLLFPVEAAAPLSDIADACLGATWPVVGKAFAAAHGHVPGGQLAVVSLGRLGSREMTVTSPLDLMLVYDHPANAVESDGRRALAPDRYYGQLSRRFIAAIRAATAEGTLYDVDMQPRPSGNAGPIVTSLASFIEHFGTVVPAWQHQALARARVVWAEGDLGERFEEARRAALANAPPPEDLAAQLATLREEARGESADEDIWAIEQKRGGLIDTEFVAQYLQLLHAAETDGVLAGDSASVFEAAGSHGLIEPDAARELADATTLWRNLHGILSLTVEEGFVEATAPPALLAVIERACDVTNIDSLKEAMRETAARTAGHYDRLLGNGDA